MSLKGILKQNKAYEVGLTHMLVAKTTSSRQNRVLEQHGLASIEWLVLGIVCNETPAGGIRVTDLARLLEVKTTYITSVLRFLKDKDFVQTRKNPHDARVRLVVATKKAVRIVNAIEDSLRESTERALKSKVTDEQFRSYLHVLHEIANIQD